MIHTINFKVSLQWECNSFRGKFDKTFLIHFHFQLYIVSTFDPFSSLNLQNTIEKYLQELYFENIQLQFVLILKTTLKVHLHRVELRFQNYF